MMQNAPVIASIHDVGESRRVFMVAFLGVILIAVRRDVQSGLAGKRVLSNLRKRHVTGSGPLDD